MRIVGISPSHDSSVCVYNDGEIEYFFKEERLCGIKKESKPYLMIEAQKTLMGPVDLCVIALQTVGVYSVLIFLRKDYLSVQ